MNKTQGHKAPKALDIETLVILKSFWETSTELTKSATTLEQLSHIRWLGKMVNQLENKLKGVDIDE